MNFAAMLMIVALGSDPLLHKVGDCTQLEQSEEGAKVYMDALLVRLNQLAAEGLSPSDAIKRAQQEPELNELWRRSMKASSCY